MPSLNSGWFLGLFPIKILFTWKKILNSDEVCCWSRSLMGDSCQVSTSQTFLAQSSTYLIENIFRFIAIKIIIWGREESINNFLFIVKSINWKHFEQKREVRWCLPRLTLNTSPHGPTPPCIFSSFQEEKTFWNIARVYGLKARYARLFNSELKL